MLQFTKLRVTGFKSFVDQAELLIEPGLTGIVGPNGCGKSNLIEALRWVMGETSARQMRGGEMDDVIFAGSAERPGRNFAEVVVELDNGAGAAPPPWGDERELLVSRRIERAKGSVYRLNGREVRARDVHLLLADAATGARSAALVTQGQVAQMIAAKPAERRALLEEAAGIVGLHARRHEAELRLQSAEANLRRVDDVLSTLDVQRQQLKKQARQASRYRNVSQQIRALEATILWLKWRSAEAAHEAARVRLADAERTVAAATGASAAAATGRTEVAAIVFPTCAGTRRKPAPPCSAWRWISICWRRKKGGRRATVTRRALGRSSSRRTWPASGRWPPMPPARWIDSRRSARASSNCARARRRRWPPPGRRSPKPARPSPISRRGRSL